MSRTTAKANLDKRVGDPVTKWLTPARLKEMVDVVYDDFPVGGGGGGSSWEVNVQDHGATGDGTTDDTTSIQAAITAAGVGGTVVFPPGDYRISAAITPLSKQIIIGTHSPRYETVDTSVCRLRATSGFSSSALIIANPGVAGVTIRNLSLVGRGSTTGTIAGVYYNTRASSTGERHWMLQQVSISACSTAAIYGHLHVGDFRDCHFFMNGYGVLTSGSDTWFDTRMIGCQVYFNRHGGVMFDSTGTAGQVVISDTRIERSGVDPTAITTPFDTNAPGVKLGAAGNIQLIGCSTDSNTGPGLWIEQSASHYVYNVSVIGCHFARDGAGDEATSQLSGIYLKGCSHIKIVGCTVGPGYSVDGASSGLLHPYYALWMENATQTDVSHCRMEGSAPTYDLWVHVVAGTVFQSRLYLAALGYDGPIPDPSAGTPYTALGKWGTLDGLTTEAKSIRYQQSTVPRWNVTAGDEAAGAHLTVDRFNDAGTYQDTPIHINRSTGALTVNQQLARPNTASAIPLEVAGASGQSTSFFRVSDYTFTPFINARSDKVFEVNYGSATYGMVRQGSTLICRDGAGAGYTLIGAGNSIASPGTFVFEVRGDGATKIGPAVNSDDAVQKTYVDDKLSGVVASSLVDAKGDLLTATADNTPARLAAGSDGVPLRADSSASTGLAWPRDRLANPVGNFFYLDTYSQSASLTALQGYQFCWPVFNPYPVTISEVRVYVDGAAAAGGLLRLGLYNSSAGGFAVGTLLADLGQVDHSATGVKAITGLSVALPAGIFWCSYALQGTGAGGGTLGGAIPRVPVSWSVSTAHSQGNAQYQSGVTGAFGTFTYGGLAYGPLPVFEFKRSA